MSMGKRLLTALFTLALAGTACGGSSSEASAGGDTSVAISEPADGAEVRAPFRLELTAGVELGPPDSGRHHVHVFYDGNEDDYAVVETATFKVEDLSPGEHTIHASLRNADHSAAGADDTVAVTVAAGQDAEPGSGEEGEGDEGDEGGGYGY
jgi:hypothetical protein